MTIVKFETGKIFYIDENGVKTIYENELEFQILVVKNINASDLKKALEQGYKLFECKESEDICIEKIYNILYSRKKSCKFA